MNILLCGDSFAADYSVKYKGSIGWPNMLAYEHNLTNLAEAGVSEFKICKQIESSNLKNFDTIIVSHTSPFRIPIKQHPDHHDDILHKNCDLIYSDIKHSTNSELKCAVEFFERFFDIDYAIFVHKLILKHEIELLRTVNIPVIHLTHFPQEFSFDGLKLLDFSDMFKSKENKGDVNHYSSHCNKLIFDILSKELL